MESFNTASCKDLAGKTKMLVLDCCRGVRDDSGLRIARDQPVKTKGVSSHGSASVIHASNANWWMLNAANPGMSAPAEHADSKLSPLTHWLQACFKKVAGGLWSLQDAQSEICRLAHNDLNQGKVGATVPNTTCSLQAKVYFGQKPK